MKRLLCAGLVVGLLSAPSPAQVRVVKQMSGKTSVSLTGLRGDNHAAVSTFKRVLNADLAKSGWFVVSGAPSAAYQVRGACRVGGDRLKVECQVYRAGDQARVMGEKYTAGTDEAVRTAHRVADDIIEAVTGKPGIFSTRIVMVGLSGTSKELFLCDADGSNLMQLTRDRSLSVAPGWAPDGDSILYTSYLRRFPDVYRIELSSGRRTAVADYPGLNTGAAVSPDGRSLALILSKDGNPELYVRPLNGRSLTRITRTGRGNEASPCWSPDGRSIVYVSDTSGRPQLYIVSAAGGQPRRLRLRGSENVAPDWGSNGLIAYAGRTAGQYHIFVVDPASGVEKQITSGGADYEDPSWAPDGRHIVCSRTENHQSAIYILDSMGDPPVALHTFRGDWVSPAWSPR